MVKIKFAGNPPMIDFTVVKLDGGENLVDNKANMVYSLSTGELAKITTDAGEALRRTIEATLKTMNANQSIRVQLMVHGNVGFTYLPPGTQYAPSYGDKVRFLTSDNDSGNVIRATPNDSGNNQPEQVQNIIIVGSESIDDQGGGSIKHATTYDNEDKNENRGDIINAK